MIKYIFTLGLFTELSTENIFGQTSPIQLDRPDQTECPFIVPKKYIQFENGFTFENTSPQFNSYSFPSTLWKYGLNEKLEIRLITELISISDSNSNSTGVNPITIGFKTNICQEKGIIPTTSFIGHFTTSEIGSKEFHTTYAAPSFRFLMQHTISKSISLAYNLGAEWDGETAEPTYIYTLTTGVSFTGKLGGYVEFFGFIPQYSKSNHSFDFGLTYLINNDFIIDLSSGLGLTENAPNYYLSLGLSNRFKTVRH